MAALVEKIVKMKGVVHTVQLECKQSFTNITYSVSNH